MNDTLAIDLSRSWSQATVNISRISKDVGVPILNFGTLWPANDEQSFYSFGGVASASPLVRTSDPAVNLWQCSNGSWSEVGDQYDNAPSFSEVRPAGGLGTFGHGVGYLLGGFQAFDTDRAGPWWPIPGLLSYNTSSNIWSNLSSTGFSQYGTALFGNVQFVPNIGPEGVLIAFGGQESPPSPWTNTAQNFMHFSNMSIYDIAARTWHWQTTTGDTPPDSILSCITGVKSDRDTYEIFLFGGQNDTLVLGPSLESAGDEAEQSDFRTVYILSLPGFVWFKTSARSAQPRACHTCELIGNRQMMGIGGLDPTAAGLTEAEAQIDLWPQSLGIFDLVELQWTGGYNATALPYTPASLVQNWYSQP